LPRYRLIAHTADIGVAAGGNTLEEAFGNAAGGMFAVMTDRRKVREVERRTVEIKEAGLEALLFEWLNRLLYIFDVEHLLFRRFDIKFEGETGLKAVCYGEKYDPARHNLKLGVKAATYHRLSVDKARNRVRVIFDI